MITTTPDGLSTPKSTRRWSAPTTTATWTPLLGTIRAVVTDQGGMLSHPVLVVREYGIPAVTGCTDATSKIRTGDKIKVDGDLCRVYVL